MHSVYTLGLTKNITEQLIGEKRECFPVEFLYVENNSAKISMDAKICFLLITHAAIFMSRDISNQLHQSLTSMSN